MSVLIVTEKPKVAERIANSIGNANKKNKNGVAYYQIDDIFVVPAVGHLFGLKEKHFKGWNYPVFEIDWVPSHTLGKNSQFTKKYLSNISELSKKCDTFINACDYDIEGEVIGYNVIKYGCNVDPFSKNVKRMKYSTLTKDSIVKAYNHLDMMERGMAEAGITRHFLDWYWGINLSRALSNSARVAKKYVTLSIGRVQGPTLKILTAREKSIRAFNPEKYWQVELDCIKEKNIFKSLHINDKFSDIIEATKVKETCGPKAVVLKVESRKHSQNPPFPFDLTTLQTEAYRHHGIDPRTTLNLAQDLYTTALISYPRTSSQQIPDDIDCRTIISKIKNQIEYEKECGILLGKKELKPANGKKTDPAHPAIHPTGETPLKLDGTHKKIYDLVVRRFFSTFGEKAIRQTMKVTLDNNGEQFISKGTITVEKGWHNLYQKYAKFEEIELPLLEKNEIVDVKDILIHEKETQPPKRYTPASIIREMEKRNIGTKSTRSQIVDILFRRGYVNGKALEVSDLGINVVDTLEKYCPEVLSESLTRKFEDDMNLIREGKLTYEKVIKDGENAIKKISSDFKKNEKQIGESLGKSIADARKQANSLGNCLECDGDLVLRNSKFGGFFIGCNKYPKCRCTLPLPKGLIKKTDTCKICEYAIVTVINKGKRPWKFCVNPNCESRKKKQ